MVDAIQLPILLILQQSEGAIKFGGTNTQKRRMNFGNKLTYVHSFILYSFYVHK